jgi:hypothetical protein
MTDTSTNTMALPCLQPYRVTALAMAYLELVATAPPQVVLADLPRAGTVTATRKRSQQTRATWPRPKGA